MQNHAWALLVSPKLTLQNVHSAMDRIVPRHLPLREVALQAPPLVATRRDRLQGTEEAAMHAQHGVRQEVVLFTVVLLVAQRRFYVIGAEQVPHPAAG